ncbi:hypothetical protein OB2597_14431 [Pseudooceanicola batsensis HTCC2597]|uniref:RNA-binding protein n=1 Tax=Pseudooceanicola batsensis (strain ATCC BAA-863 / DSM 15984 / KCTC 12145 / HTCC2597) TaxID=252305 RepID=A3U248_PSEBH|nr:DUF721 domain-containing protein [Pseudooceanicola batsensis]EAQ01648.1 hypothetical protein OB2597_14431 [Pseudooceanicola batsensis HTCC2597]
MNRRNTSTYGFSRASKLLEDRIRRAGESRGFAVTRLLTHWEEIAGDLATMARPVDVRFGRQGFGATLTLLTTGPMAPMVEMQKETLREKVNAVYGYNAISRIRVTQTAATGFAEGQVAFSTRGTGPEPPRPSPEVTARARDVAGAVGDDGLRSALEALARNVLSKHGK